MDYKEECELMLVQWEKERDAYRQVIRNPTAFYNMKGDTTLLKKMRADARVVRKEIIKAENKLKSTIRHPKGMTKASIKRMLKDYKDR